MQARRCGAGEAASLRGRRLLAVSGPVKGRALRYYLDTEFNGFGGGLISLALVRQDGASLYLVYDTPQPVDPWVERHVLPKLQSVPAEVQVIRVGQTDGAWAIGQFLKGDPDPDVIADWPDDIRLFCAALMLGPGSTVLLERLKFEILRVEPYPTDLEGVVEHNAWWDAMALRRRLMRHEMIDG
jgi:hypothetical protein